MTRLIDANKDWYSVLGRLRKQKKIVRFIRAALSLDFNNSTLAHDALGPSTPLSCSDFDLQVKREMIGVTQDQHMGDGCLSGDASLEKPRPSCSVSAPYCSAVPPRCVDGHPAPSPMPEAAGPGHRPGTCRRLIADQPMCVPFW